MAQEEGAFTLKIGRNTVEVPALTLGQVKRICLALPAIGNGLTEVGFDAELEILHAGLSEAMPGLTKDNILDTLRLGRRAMARAVREILIASELIDPKPPEKAPGEAVPPGNDPGAASA